MAAFTRNRLTRLALTCAAIAVSMAAGADLISLAQAGTASTYYACKNVATGSVRLLPSQLPTPLNNHCNANPVDPSQKEVLVSWNQLGPQGPAGLPGPVGSPGPQGPSGVVAWVKVDLAGDLLDGNGVISQSEVVSTGFLSPGGRYGVCFFNLPFVAHSIQVTPELFDYYGPTANPFVISEYESSPAMFWSGNVGKVSVNCPAAAIPGTADEAARVAYVEFTDQAIGVHPSQVLNVSFI